MSAKASTLKSSIENFIRRQGIDAEMEQNLVKEAIHLHLLSAMSGAGILRHAVFQGGTAPLLRRRTLQRRPRLRLWQVRILFHRCGVQGPHRNRVGNDEEDPQSGLRHRL